jgi:ABC-type dipeptide/oligopeptide/nickel transport system permease subunit
MKATVIALWCFLLVLSATAPVSEFGRPMGSEVLASTAISVLFGAVVTAVTAGVATLAAIAYLHFRLDAIRAVSTAVADIVDSVPGVLWVLVAVVVVDEPRQLVAPSAFVLLSAPAAIRLVVGECIRQVNLPYVLAARAIGVGSWRLLIRHMVPNGRATLLPFLLQIFGTGLAIHGAVGVLGVGNRSDLNLGTLLLRGKEQFLTSPWLLCLSVASYLAIFSTLFFIESRRRQP